VELRKNFFLPLLRNDFRLIEEHNKIDKLMEPLKCDITVFIGKDEEFVPEQIDGWKNITNNFCTVCYFNGGHFFINQEFKRVVQIINNTFFSA